MIKKLFFFSFLTLVVTMQIFAQRDDVIELSSKSNAIRLGPKIGIGLTTMGQPNEGKVYDGPGIGLIGGASLKARFGRATADTRQGGTGLIGVGLEVLYKQNKVKCVDGLNLTLGYLEIPVSLQLYPMKKSNVMNRFYIEAGADFAKIISKSPSELKVPSINTTYKTSDFSGGDIRVLAGLGYTIPTTGLDISARYYIGMSKLAGNFPCKQNTLEVSLAWLFDIATF